MKRTMSKKEKPKKSLLRSLGKLSVDLLLWPLRRIHTHKKTQAAEQAPKLHQPAEVIRRKNSLSATHKNQKRTAKQRKSGFFDLPPELRLEIFGHLVGGRRGIVYIDLMNHLQFGSWCQHDPQYASEYPDTNCPIKSYALGYERKKVTPGIGIMGWLRSCRRAYTEAISVLYEYPTFLFENYASAVILLSTIPQQHFQRIQSLQINHHSGTGFGNFPVSLRCARPQAYHHILQNDNQVPVDELYLQNYARYPNSALASNGPPGNSDGWVHMCKIICQMDGLKEFKFFVIHRPSTYDRGGPILKKPYIQRIQMPYDESEVREGEEYRLIMGMDILLAAKPLQDWAVFELSLPECYPRHDPTLETLPYLKVRT